MTREELARLREHTVGLSEVTVTTTTLRALLDALEAAEGEVLRLDQQRAIQKERAERAEADFKVLRKTCDVEHAAREHAEADLAERTYEKDILRSEVNRLAGRIQTMSGDLAELRAGVSLAAQGLAAWSGVPGDEGRVRGVEHSLRALLKGEPT